MAYGSVSSGEGSKCSHLHCVPSKCECRYSNSLFALLLIICCLPRSSTLATGNHHRRSVPTNLLLSCEDSASCCWMLTSSVIIGKTAGYLPGCTCRLPHTVTLAKHTWKVDVALMCFCHRAGIPPFPASYNPHIIY